MEIFGVKIYSKSYINIIKEISNENSQLENYKKFHVHFVNAFTMTEVHAIPSLRNSLEMRNAINFADGKSIDLAFSFLYHKRYSMQVRGVDFLVETFRRTSGNSVQHAFVGSTPEVILKCVEKLNSEYPQRNIPLTLSPPFSDWKFFPFEEISGKLRASNVQVCWLAMGTPKQDFIAPILSDMANCHVICIGAAVNYLAGDIKPPHPLVIKYGLEWLYRFTQEPKRLFRRYFLGLPKFFLLLLRYKFFAN